MADAFDPTPYLRSPVLNVASGVGLASALLAATPKQAPPGVKKAAKRLRASAVALQEAWSTVETSSTGPDARLADRAVDNGWAALYGRLESYAALPVERHPKAVRAAELLNALFPDGLTFLKLPYAAEWAESKKRIDQVAREGWAVDIDGLAGPEFLEEVGEAHAAYGKAIGVTAARPEAAPNANVAEPLRVLARAISAYATQLVAAADVEDQASLQVARAALRPLDDHRAGAPRRAKGEAPAATPTSPLPPASD